jgi:hypothetical protein
VTALAGRRPLAVTVDLDDTLFPQREVLDGAWHEVAATGASMGAPERPLLAALTDVASEGSDRGRIIDRALQRCRFPASPEFVAARRLASLPSLAFASAGGRGRKMRTSTPGGRSRVRAGRSGSPATSHRLPAVWHEPARTALAPASPSRA